MGQQTGNKKLYKAHKTWIAAGLAAATLFSTQVIGTGSTSVSAADETGTTVVDQTAQLQKIVANGKAAVQQLGVSEAKNAATGRTFNGDFDYLAGQIRAGKITTKEQLDSALTPILKGLTPVLKEQVKSKIAAVGADINPETGRTFYGDIDYLFNNSTIGTSATGIFINLDYAELSKVQASADAAIAAKEAAAQAAALKAEANQAFRDGYQYGETNAVRPDLAGKSDNYKKGFEDGYKAGAAKYKRQQQAQAAEATKAFNLGYQYGETGAVLPDLSGKTNSYKLNFQKGWDAGNAIRQQKLEAQKAEANEAFRLGQQYGETGAVLPDLTGKSNNYVINFKKGFAAGDAIRQQKLEAQKAEANEAFRDGQRYGETGAKLPDLSGKSNNYVINFNKGFAAGDAIRQQKLAAQKDEANQAFRDGQRYGETGAVLPDITGKSKNYQVNFQLGWDAGNAARQLKLEAQKAEANEAFRDGQRYGETGAVLPDITGKSKNYQVNFQKGWDAGNATRQQKLEAQKAEANEAFRDGQRYGETGAVVPDITGKSKNYQINFQQGWDAGNATRQAKLTAQKAEANEAFRDGQRYGETGAVVPDLSDKSANYQKNFQDGWDADNAARQIKLESQKDEANQAFRDGQQYGETGAQVPDLSNKSKNYQDNFQKGWDAGNATRQHKLEAEKAEADEAYHSGYQYGETGAVLPDLTGKSDNYKKNFQKGWEDGNVVRLKKLQEGKKDPEPKPQPKPNPVPDPVPSPKPATKSDEKPSVKPLGNQNQAGNKKALPQTGDATNPVASSLGVVAVLGTLLGFAGTSLKKRA